MMKLLKLLKRFFEISTIFNALNEDYYKIQDLELRKNLKEKHKTDFIDGGFWQHYDQNVILYLYLIFQILLQHLIFEY